MTHTTSPLTSARGGRSSFGVTAATFCLVGILVVGQMYVAIPLIPQLAAEWRVDSASASWATSAFALAYAFGSLFSGPLSERLTRRRVMVGGVAAMSVATVLIPFATDLLTGSVLRAAQGLLAGAFVPMAYAHFTATIPRPRLPLALTLISASMGGTVVLGQVESQLVATTWGWRAVFWGTAPLLILAALVVRHVMREPEPVARPDGPVAPYAGLVPRIPSFLFALLVAGSLTAIYTSIQLDGPPALVSSDESMLWLRVSALPSLLGAVLLAPWLGRLRPAVRVSASFAIAALALVPVVLDPGDPWVIGAALTVFMLGMSTAGPALVQLIGTGAGSTTAIAVYGFMLNAGGGVGAQLPAWVPDLATLALLLAVLLAVASIRLACVVSRRPRPSAPAVEPTT